jgi:hypothetical protein
MTKNIINIIGMEKQEKIFKNKIVFVLLLFFLSQSLCSCKILQQDSVCRYCTTIDKKQVYSFAEEMPDYPGGKSEMFKFFIKNMQNQEQDVLQSTFVVEFIIDKKGHIVNPHIKDNPTNVNLTNMEKEVLRVFCIMPKWIPGKRNNKNVNTIVMEMVRVEFF